MVSIAVIETTSNQNFIFGTNRLREIVGGSEIIYAAVVDLVLEACGYKKEDIKIARKRGGLSRFEKAKDSKVRFLLITSGKAILIGEESELKDVIRKVTERALVLMPGMTVRGGIAEAEEETAERLNAAIKKAHEQLNVLRSRIPSNDLRFQRLPVVAECTSSGLPAWGELKVSEGETIIVSESVKAKRFYRNYGWERLTTWLHEQDRKWFVKSIDELEERMQSRIARWVAVVHADGNGLGQIFMDFLNRSGAKDYNDYITKYRNFSLALEECTIVATQQAIKDVWGEEAKEIPFIPIIVGGDDLTVICEGAKAVPFTQAFLREFEKQTENRPEITAIAKKGLTACAGIAIVKPHFPFHRAYKLAEALIASAKDVGKKDENNYRSALHYHVHFDSSGADWEHIHRQLDVPGPAHLSMQPWIVFRDNESRLAKNSLRSISRLWKGISALKQRDEDGRSKLPRSQQHALREALFAGKEIAGVRLRRIQHRYENVDWGSILPAEDSPPAEGCLFIQRDGQWVTPLLDMMDLADLMGWDDLGWIKKEIGEEQPA